MLLNANWPCNGGNDQTLYSDLNTNIGNAYISATFARRVGLSSSDANLANNLWTGRSQASEVRRGAEGCKWAFLNLQDQLRLSFQPESYMAAMETLEALSPGTKLVVFSLSANEVGPSETAFIGAMPRPVRAFFDFLGARAASIGVRGHVAASVLSRMGLDNVVVTGCPSYFARGADRIVTPSADPDGKVVGITGSFRSSALPNPVLYLQGGAEWPLVQLLHETNTDWRSGGGPKVTPGVLIEPEDVLAGAQDRARFFTDFEAWNADLRETCTVVCGTRLHGAIVALNAGVPAIVTNADSRAQETCELFGIPWRPDLTASEPCREDLIQMADPSELNRLYPARFAAFDEWVKPFEQPRRKRAASMAPPAGPPRQRPEVVATRALEYLVRGAPRSAGGGATAPLRVATTMLEDIAPNLLPNPAFETGWTGWTPMSRNAEAHAWRRRFGPAGWWLELREDLGPDADLGLFSEWFKVTSGETLTLSAELALFSAVVGGLFGDLEWQDRSGESIGYSSQITPTAPILRRSSETFKAPAAAAAVRTRFYASSLEFLQGQGWAAIARVKLERNDRPSAYLNP